MAIGVGRIRPSAGNAQAEPNAMARIPGWLAGWNCLLLYDVLLAYVFNDPLRWASCLAVLLTATSRTAGLRAISCFLCFGTVARLEALGNLRTAIGAGDVGRI